MAGGGGSWSKNKSGSRVFLSGSVLDRLGVSRKEAKQQTFTQEQIDTAKSQLESDTQARKAKPAPQKALTMFEAKLKKGDLMGAIDQSLLLAEGTKAQARKAIKGLQDRQDEMDRKADEALAKYPLIGESTPPPKKQQATVTDLSAVREKAKQTKEKVVSMAAKRAEKGDLIGMINQTAQLADVASKDAKKIARNFDRKSSKAQEKIDKLADEALAKYPLIGESTSTQQKQAQKANPLSKTKQAQKTDLQTQKDKVNEALGKEVKKLQNLQPGTPEHSKQVARMQRIMQKRDRLESQLNNQPNQPKPEKQNLRPTTEQQKVLAKRFGNPQKETIEEAEKLKVDPYALHALNTEIRKNVPEPKLLSPKEKEDATKLQKKMSEEWTKEVQSTLNTGDRSYDISAYPRAIAVIDHVIKGNNDSETASYQEILRYRDSESNAKPISPLVHETLDKYGQVYIANMNQSQAVRVVNNIFSIKRETPKDANDQKAENLVYQAQLTALQKIKKAALDGDETAKKMLGYKLRGRLEF